MKRALLIIGLCFLLGPSASAQNPVNHEQPQDFTINSALFPVYSLNAVPISGASIALVGNPGPATWCYWASANYQIGNVLSPLGCIYNAPNILTSSNYVSITPYAYPPGVVTVDILATTTNIAPTGACNCAVATGLTSGGANQESNTLSSYTVSIVNPSSYSLVMRNEVVGSNSAHLLLRNASTLALICDLSTACGSSGGGVTSITGDGALFTNSGSTGAVTLTLGGAAAHTVWGNPSGSTATPGYTTNPSVATLAVSGNLTTDITGVSGGNCVTASSTGLLSGTGSPCGSGSGGITGSGTSGTIPIFTGTSAIGNSSITQTGSGSNVNTHVISNSGGTIGTVLDVENQTTGTCSVTTQTLPLISFSNNQGCSGEQGFVEPGSTGTVGGTAAGFFDNEFSSSTALGLQMGVYAEAGNAPFAGAVTTTDVAVYGRAEAITQTTNNYGLYGFADNFFGASSETLAENDGVVAQTGMDAASSSVTTEDASLHVLSPIFSSGGVMTAHYGILVEDQTVGGAQNPSPFSILTKGTAPSTLGGALTVSGNLATNITGTSGGNCVTASNTGVLTGTGTPCGSGSGFTAGGDLTGSSTNQTVKGLNAVPFCTGFTPTAGQVLEYTTSSSPNPCYTAAANGSSISGTIGQPAVANSGGTVNGTSNLFEDCSQEAGSTLDVILNNCNARVITNGGGYMDARALGGTTAKTISAQVEVSQLQAPTCAASGTGTSLAAGAYHLTIALTSPAATLTSWSSECTLTITAGQGIQVNSPTYFGTASSYSVAMTGAGGASWTEDQCVPATNVTIGTNATITALCAGSLISKNNKPYGVGLIPPITGTWNVGITTGGVCGIMFHDQGSYLGDTSGEGRSFNVSSSSSATSVSSLICTDPNGKGGAGYYYLRGLSANDVSGDTISNAVIDINNFVDASYFPSMHAGVFSSGTLACWIWGGGDGSGFPEFQCEGSGLGEPLKIGNTTGNLTIGLNVGPGSAVHPAANLPDIEIAAQVRGVHFHGRTYTECEGSPVTTPTVDFIQIATLASLSGPVIFDDVDLGTSCGTPGSVAMFGVGESSHTVADFQVRSGYNLSFTQLLTYYPNTALNITATAGTSFGQIGGDTNQPWNWLTNATIGGTLSVGGNLTTNVTGTANNCLQASSAGVVSGTGSSCGGSPGIVAWFSPTVGTTTMTGVTQNTTRVYGIYIPQALTTVGICYDVGTADNSANVYDIGIYSASGTNFATGTLQVHTGPTAGTTLFAATGIRCEQWAASGTIPQGYAALAFTSSAATPAAEFGGGVNIMGAPYGAQNVGTTTSGTLNSSQTLPNINATSWANSNNVNFQLH